MYGAVGILRGVRRELDVARCEAALIGDSEKGSDPSRGEGETR